MTQQTLIFSLLQTYMTDPSVVRPLSDALEEAGFLDAVEHYRVVHLKHGSIPDSTCVWTYTFLEIKDKFIPRFSDVPGFERLWHWLLEERNLFLENSTMNIRKKED